MLRALVLGASVTAGSLAGVAAAQTPCSSALQPFDAVTNSLRGVDGIVQAQTLWDPDASGPRQPVLLVGGTFRIAGDVPSANIAVYDFETRRWSNLGTAVTFSVRQLVATPTGEIFVTGGPATTGTFPFLGTVARWDGSGWTVFDTQQIEGGPLHVRRDGSLIMFGTFRVDGAKVLGVGAWNGSGFDVIATGGPATVPGGPRVSASALTTLVSGDIVIGGSFRTIGDTVVNSIARWDGSRWQPLGSGMIAASSYSTGAGTVRSLLVTANGDLVAGGRFTSAGGVATNRIARWDGSAWNAMSEGILTSDYANGTVESLVPLPDGQLLATGSFLFGRTTGIAGIARWDGTRWSAVPGTSTGPRVVTVLPGGGLIASGAYSFIGGVPADSVAAFDGSTWSAVGRGMSGPIFAMNQRPDNGLIIGGDFRILDNTQIEFLAQSGPNGWTALAGGVNGPVRVLARIPGGDLIVGGKFTRAGDSSVMGIARWDGARWASMGLPPFSNDVTDIAVLPAGEIVVSATLNDQQSAPRGTVVAQWDGAAWTQLGDMLPLGRVRLAPGRDGRIIAAGRFFRGTGSSDIRSDVARWNGSAWVSLAPSAELEAAGILSLPSGEVLATGRLNPSTSSAAEGLLRWNGSGWSLLVPSSGSDYLHFAETLLLRSNGEVLIGRSNGWLGRWNGSAILPVSSNRSFGGVNALATANDGRVIVASSVPGFPDVSRLTLVDIRDPFTILQQPTDRAVCHAEPASFTVALAPVNDGPVTFQWYKGSVRLTGTWTGGPNTFSITSVAPADVGEYWCLITSPCGAMTTARARLTIPCLIDYTCDGGVTELDVLVFLNRYFARNRSADFNADGGITPADVFAFLRAYFAGC
jgi:trimeric autotransporter adhesin